MPKEKMKRLLYELMKDARRSDRELAKIVEVSQPTITRARKEFEKLGFIREYTIIPEFSMLGFEIMAFTSFNTTSNISSYIESESRIIFGAPGSGMGDKNYVIISLHKDFTDFNEFILKLRGQFGQHIASMETFLVSLKTKQMKHLSFKQLEEIFKEE